MTELSEKARILFNPKRFEIATILFLRGKTTMAVLRRATGLSWGDLDSNLRYMETKGLVNLRKTLTRRGPRTIVELTSKGVKAYVELAHYLRNIIPSFEDKSRSSQRM